MSGQFPAGNYQFEIVERELLWITESSKRKYLHIYDVKIKCQRMGGECLPCPTGRTAAAQEYVDLRISAPRNTSPW